MAQNSRFENVRNIGEICTEDEQLFKLLSHDSNPVCLDRFDPSGRIHIAQGLAKIINVKKLIKAGCKVKIVIADRFAFLNNKFGGDMEKIQTIGQYIVEVFKAARLNLHEDNVEFLWSSQEIKSRASEYWPLVMGIARHFKISRLKRCVEVMGLNKHGQDDLSKKMHGQNKLPKKKQVQDDGIMVANLLYICMQCADLFFFKADICQMGMDQHEVNLLAREYSDAIEREKKPIILSHHMLPGLKQGQEKMSKSDTSSCIFMDDTEAEVTKKINQAYCPPRVVQGNPLIECIKFIIFPWDDEFKVERKDDNGGEKIFKSIEELVLDYESGALHPADLKPALSKALNKIMQPIRNRFDNDSDLKDLLERVKILTETNKPSSRQTPKGRKSSKMSLEKSEVPKDMTASICMHKVQPLREDLPHELPNKEQFKTCEKLAQTSIHGSRQVEKNQGDQSCSNSSSIMSLEKRFNKVRSMGEECIQEEELRKLLRDKLEPICYDGFEPSGKMHIAQGVTKMINVNKLTDANCKVKIWIADWFAQLNNKIGGDLEKIRTVGKYMIEIWKALGLNLQGDKVEFLWASEEIDSRADEYWSLVMDIAKSNSLNRIMRCVQIMGRSEQDDLTVAQMLYPCMQCADVFFLKADICQMGMDQRKVNVLAREYCDNIKRKEKPIILSHSMLPGLKQGQEKMSKSDPSSSIFMDDDEDSVNMKIEGAFCPPRIVDGNPCFMYIKHLLFPLFGKFIVNRSNDQGGNKTFKSFEELVEDYESGKLLPKDLQSSLSKALNGILKPVQDHLKNDPVAKKLKEEVDGFSITR